MSTTHATDAPVNVTRTLPAKPKRCRTCGADGSVLILFAFDDGTCEPACPSCGTKP